MSDSVFVGYCHRLEVSARFHNSLAELLDYDRTGPRRIVGKCALLSGPRIAEARCQIVDEFIRHQPEADWLLMLDSDMTFAETLVDDLLKNASPHAAPVVGGLCFGGVHGARIFPTVYRSFNEDDGHVAIEPELDYPRDALVKVAATGAACLLIHRSVIGAMRRPGPKPGERFDPNVHGFGTLANGQPSPYPWFIEGLTTAKGVPLGEDVAFARRLMHLGIPLYVDTSVKLGHCKEWVLSEDDFLTYRREVNRPGPLLDAALAVLRESGRFTPDDLDQIAEYLRPRHSILSDTERPKPKPFALPEMASV